MQRARQLGRYQLLDRIAFGGMAEIYRAKTCDGEGRTHLVAVKRVLGHLCEDEEFIQMLVDEAKITAALQHENIARIYEFCRTDREYFIAMEYVDGKDVRALLEKARQNQDTIPEEHVAWTGMEVARALHAAHTQRDRDGRPLRIVHRDVSPSNVLLSYRGDVKLCDFGIAKATLTRVQTKTGVIKGKVKYMSPEQAMGRKLDHRSDLFSLGTLLYEMLTLQAPFQAPTEIELIFAVRDARKRPLREMRPGIHPHLEVIVDRAMARSRSQRFQSGEEVAQSLEAFLQQVYPDYRRSTFGRYLRSVFAREIDHELRQLEEYVIEGGNPEEVGQNLLADVLGPDAPYTQFTAAFVEGAQEIREMNMAAQQRLESAALLDSHAGSVIERPLTEQETGPRQLPAIPRNEGDLRRQIDAGWGPAPPTTPATWDLQPQRLRLPPQAETLSADQAPAMLFDREVESLHDEQTRILTRVHVSVRHPELHEAQTRLFDIHSLPRHQQEKLRGAQDQMERLDTELHEADTVFLPRASVRGPLTPGGELPLPGGTRLPLPTGDDVGYPENAPTALRPNPHPAPLAGGAPPTFSDQPTQPGGMSEEATRVQTGSIELKTGDVSFLSSPPPHQEPAEPSVVLDEDDLVAIE